MLKRLDQARYNFTITERSLECSLVEMVDEDIKHDNDVNYTESKENFEKLKKMSPLFEKHKMC